MRRGRLILYVVLIVVVGLIAALLFFKSKKPANGGQLQATPTPSAVSVVIAGQNIPPSTQITANMLATIQIPQNMLLATYFTDVNAVIGQFAKYQLDQGVFITTSMVSPNMGDVNVLGSRWSTIIKPGYAAIAIPITRLSAAAYGIRDGDHVDVIVSMLIVDLDPDFQSKLPNNAAAVLPENGNGVLIGGGTAENASGQIKDTTTLTAQPVSGMSLSPLGRIVMDPNLQSPFYVVPSEAQRPRLVSQMIIQNVIVLHVGTFPLANAEEAVQPQVGDLTPTPAVSVVAQERPDIITLIVSPQQAVSLTYLMFSGAKLTLTLRNPTDNQSWNPNTATLDFIFTQYNISAPAKQAYGIEPRLDNLETDLLPNDIVVVTPSP